MNDDVDYNDIERPVTKFQREWIQGRRSAAGGAVSRLVSTARGARDQASSSGADPRLPAAAYTPSLYTAPSLGAWEGRHQRSVWSLDCQGKMGDCC